MREQPQPAAGDDEAPASGDAAGECLHEEAVALARRLAAIVQRPRSAREASPPAAEAAPEASLSLP
ncbi:MAG: hypothetical protein RMM29_07805 [Planctomycetota bacterium]|nr:hypothetical protein [Planctomycetota bacterium]MCX8039172.1 hypothetical protein [Planctomycetota bacterium]MDW8373533.1 hypothetical protein [Planctomycetota bacterium]